MYGKASFSSTLSPERHYRPTMTWIQWRRFIRVVSDTAAFFFIVVVFIICFALIHRIQPPIMGFFCEDTSIRYPLKASTIPDWAVIVGGISLPVVIVSRKKIIIMMLLIS